MFIDEIEIKVTAGRGGDGCSSFRREKYVEMGGPDGGNGGKGGDIIFIAESGLKTLIDLRYKKNIKGEKGINGMGKNRTGAVGENTYIKVPIGTTVRDRATGLIICDLVKHGEECIVAKGGKGGRGNLSFKSNKNTAPTISEYGEEGEEKILKCELKLLADIGLVGLPSVGKSTLISVISAAKPKIADYHFTTLSPNLGVVSAGEDSFTVADLPGLIEGASEGHGLGDKFLRHVERTKVICHVIDMSASEGRTPIEDYKTIIKELSKYNERISKKPSIIIANKMDMPNAEDNLTKFKKEIKDIEIIPISALRKDNLNTLIYKLKDLVKEHENNSLYEEDEFEDYVLYKFKEEKPFEITKEKDHYWVLKGEQLEKLLKKTKFNGEESMLRFAMKLKKLGVDEKLEELGAEEEDIVRILDFEFEYRRGL